MNRWEAEEKMAQMTKGWTGEAKPHRPYQRHKQPPQPACSNPRCNPCSTASRHRCSTTSSSGSPAPAPSKPAAALVATEVKGQSGNGIVTQSSLLRGAGKADAVDPSWPGGCKPPYRAGYDVLCAKGSQEGMHSTKDTYIH